MWKLSEKSIFDPKTVTVYTLRDGFVYPAQPVSGGENGISFSKHEARQLWSRLLMECGFSSANAEDECDELFGHTLRTLAGSYPSQTPAG